VKVGDIVKPKKSWIVATGIIIETGMYAGNREVKIMWHDGEIITAKKDMLEMINEHR
tara:strand:- start:183 stop:353 length:171 start_codon:yes stop_codon:yes gene_type:complete